MEHLILFLCYYQVLLCWLPAVRAAGCECDNTGFVVCRNCSLMVNWSQGENMSDPSLVLLSEALNYQLRLVKLWFASYTILTSIKRTFLCLVFKQLNILLHLLLCFPSIQVHLASSPILDAWYGARDWAVEHMTREEGWITRKDYEEKGGEYLKEHCASNVYVPIRLPKQAPRTTEALAPSRALTSSTGNPCEQA